MTLQDLDNQTNTAIDELQEIEAIIAKTHGFTVSQDDPVMIHYTMNKIILEHNIKKLSECLKIFKEDMALEAQKWTETSNKVADRITKLSISNQEKQMTNLAEDCRLKIKGELEKIQMNHQSYQKTLQRPLNTAVTLNLLASVITLVSVLMVLL